jgi:flagellin
VGTNLAQGAAVLQTADGSLEQTGNILNRMKELSTKASSGSLDATSQKAVNDEYQNLKTELDKTSNSTSFNNQKLVNGTYNNDFQTGTSATDVLNVNLTGIDSSSAGLGLTAGGAGSATALSTPTEAKAASAELDNAISKVSSYRAEIGALQSNVSARSEVVDSNIESNLSAQSAIMDADIGKSMSEFTNSKLLNEVALAAAAQGNKMSASMLKLVR